MAATDISDEVTLLQENISSLGKNMRFMSLSMRSLYTDKAVGTQSSAAKEMRQLRDETRNDAIAYLHCVLPLVTTCVTDIEDYFKCYKALTKEEWWESIDDMIEMTLGHRQACEAVIAIHEKLLVTLKKREDKAIVVVEKLNNLADKYEQEVSKLEAKAKGKYERAAWLALIPVVSTFVCPYFRSAALADTAKSIAKKTESEIHFAAATSVKEVLIPALQDFITGLEVIAGFFTVIYQELSSFERSGKSEKEATKPMIIHYKVMNKTADGIITDCKQFYPYITSIRTDFEAIPTEGTDQNYVDQWLKEQEKIIRKTCTAKHLATKLINSIPGIFRGSTSKTIQTATEL